MDARGVPCRRCRRRPRAERALIAAAVAACALIPAGGAAAASPSPSPSLDRLLASPPSAEFVADTESAGTPIGAFDLGTYAESVGPADPTAARTALRDDGFVAGYGRSWTAQSSNDGLVELVVAFAGGRGARSWLATSASEARASDFYKGPVQVDGIGQYYGVRYSDPSAPSFADVISFVKGNDYFLVGFISDAADQTDAAATQSKVQYAFAAADSIRPAQWPENASSSPFGLGGDHLAITVLIAGLAAAAVVGVAVGVVLLVALRRAPVSSRAAGSSGGSTPSTPPT